MAAASLVSTKPFAHAFASGELCSSRAVQRVTCTDHLPAVGTAAKVQEGCVWSRVE